VAIRIERIEGGYTASASPPHIAAHWATDAPMSAEELVGELRSRGCHQTDIGDAFYDADPQWLDRP
jgi:hypothetical protein